MTEEREPSSAVIAAVLIAYAEQPGLTLDELQARVEGLVGLFTLLEEPAVIRERRILSWPDGREIGPPHPLETLRFFAGHDVEILQVRYNPVVEIILGAGLATTGLLAIWQKISTARTAHYEANIKQAEAQMRQDDAQVRRWSSEAAIQEQILRGELAEVLRSRLYEMQSQHLIADGEEDEADGMINRAIQETLKIERIVPVDENRKPIKE